MEREIRFRFAGHLLPGERILWAARPGERFNFSGRDVYDILAYSFSAVILFYFVGLDPRDRPMLIFISISFGLWVSLFGGRLLYEAWLTGRTFYAVTDRRILFLCIGVGDRPRLTAIDRSQITSVDQSGSDPRGTICFSAGAQRKKTIVDKILNVAPNERIQFLKISEPNHVFRLLQGPAVGSPPPP